MINVVVRGASGMMGQEVVKAVCQEPGMRVVGAVDLEVSGGCLNLPGSTDLVPFSADLEKVLSDCKPNVMVDFTVPQAIMPAVGIAASHGVHLVIGTTGLNVDNLSEIDQLSITHKIGTVVAPNFALGAILMIHMAKIAAKYLDYAEIIEMHHEKKIDAPSGTALATARVMAAARGKSFLQPGKGDELKSRGQQVEGVAIHSVRLPGLLAHQEVILGGAGQTLSIRHDTISRECYMPGVILAIREVINRKGLVYGLDNLLGL